MQVTRAAFHMGPSWAPVGPSWAPVWAIWECCLGTQYLITVNVEMFAQYIFWRISRRAVDARKFDVSGNIIIIEQLELNGMCAKIKPRKYAS